MNIFKRSTDLSKMKEYPDLISNFESTIEKVILKHSEHFDGIIKTNTISHVGGDEHDFLELTINEAYVDTMKYIMMSKNVLKDEDLKNGIEKAIRQIEDIFQERMTKHDITFNQSIDMLIEESFNAINARKLSSLKRMV